MHNNLMLGSLGFADTATQKWVLLLLYLTKRRYVVSDGVGRISMDVAAQVMLNLNKDAKYPLAMQVSLGMLISVHSICAFCQQCAHLY